MIITIRVAYRASKVNKLTDHGAIIVRHYHFQGATSQENTSSVIQECALRPTKFGKIIQVQSLK